MSTSRLLLVVEDTFAITGRGLIVAPDVDLGERHQLRLTVELHRPDGTVSTAEALAQVPFVNPSRPGARSRHMLLFANLTKNDVPIGRNQGCCRVNLHAVRVSPIRSDRVKPASSGTNVTTSGRAHRRA